MLTYREGLSRLLSVMAVVGMLSVLVGFAAPEAAEAQVDAAAVKVLPRADLTGNYIYADYDDETYSAAVYEVEYQYKYSNESTSQWYDHYLSPQNINDKTVYHIGYSCTVDYSFTATPPTGGQVRFRVRSTEASDFTCGDLPCEGAPLRDCDTDDWLDPVTTSQVSQTTSWLDGGNYQSLTFKYGTSE